MSLNREDRQNQQGSSSTDDSAALANMFDLKNIKKKKRSKDRTSTRLTDESVTLSSSDLFTSSDSFKKAKTDDLLSQQHYTYTDLLLRVQGLISRSRSRDDTDTTSHRRITLRPPHIVRSE
jgi:hypothetical protein